MTIATASEIIWGVILLVVVLTSVVLNGFALLVFGRINRMFKNYYLGTRRLLFNLVLVDLCLAFLYSLPAAITSLTGGSWYVGASCSLYVLAATTFKAISQHTLVCLAVERFLHFYKPQLHQMMFTEITMCVLVFGIWVFDITIGLMPIIGWGQAIYNSSFFGCTFNYVASVSYQYFELIVVWIAPMLLISAFILAIIIRVERQISIYGKQPGMLLVDVTDSDPNRHLNSTINNSYLPRMSKLQKWLAFIPRHETRRRQMTQDVSCDGKMKKVLDPRQEGYGSDSGSDEELNMLPKQVNCRQGRKFRRNEYSLVYTYLLCAWLYFTCWIPLFTVHLINTNDLYIQISNTLWMTTCFLTHLSSLIHPLVFFVQNYRFREALFYSTKPHLYREEPIDLRAEKASNKTCTRNNERENSFANLPTEQDLNDFRFRSNSTAQMTTSL